MDEGADRVIGMRERRGEWWEEGEEGTGGEGRKNWENVYITKVSVAPKRVEGRKWKVRAQDGGDTYPCLTLTDTSMFLHIAYSRIKLFLFLAYLSWRLKRAIVIARRPSVRHKLSHFYAPGLKGPPGASSNRIRHLSVCLSVCPSVCNSVPLTNKVQYLKFG